MKATIAQAEYNERNLDIQQTGYGHWRVTMDYRGKRIGAVTTNSAAVDNFRSEQGERDNSGRNRIKAGYEDLCNEIIRGNN